MQHAFQTALRVNAEQDVFLRYQVDEVLEVCTGCHTIAVAIALERQAKASTISSPRPAPIALPRLKVPMFTAEARVVDFKTACLVGLPTRTRGKVQEQTGRRLDQH